MARKKIKPTSAMGSDIKNITNDDSKEVETKKEIKRDISKKVDIKNKELKEYSIPDDDEEETYNYNVKEGMNVVEDDREFLWKSFMPDEAAEEDETEENVDEKNEEKEKNSKKNYSKEEKNDHLYESMDVEEDENEDSKPLESNEVQDKAINKRNVPIKIDDRFPSDDKMGILNKGININNKMMDNVSIKMETIMENKNSTYPDSNQSLVPAINKLLLCEKCEKPFGSKMGLYNHTKSIHEGVRYSCDQCDWKGRQPYHLKQHIKTRHEGVRYSCDHCNYKARDKSNLRRHALKCQIPKPYQCSVQCSMFHNTAEHEGIHYNCSQCDYKAIHRFALKCHVESVHEGIRHSCEQYYQNNI